MSSVNIIRASAGSGKTHFLTGIYIMTLIKQRPDYFKRVLAVTFTNKATEEMKSRIIEQLDILANGNPSDYLEEIKAKTGYNESKIRNKALVILKSILHAYSWFSVETIDAFFQRIIRAFTRELNIPGQYNLETNTIPVLQYAVDSMMAEIDKESELLQWLMQFSEDRIIEGRNWDIRKDLLRLSEEVFKEEFSKHSVSLFRAIADKEKMSRFRNRLYTIIKKTEEQIADFGNKGTKILLKHAIDDSDLYYKGKGVGAYFRKLANHSVETPNSYVLRLLEGSEIWPSGTSKKKEEVIQLADQHLLPLLTDVLDCIQKNSSLYFTAKEILGNLYALGILTDISDKVSRYRYERNSFILSDSSSFLYKIIDRNDTPFVYERMGNRYRHFMIDEFQDTSSLQWSNFKPLVSNSLSSGNDCLLVGDVKQSIYRWRNSNWEILARKIQKDFPHNNKTTHLDTNYRSSEKVIQFNNILFPVAASLIQELLDSEISRSPLPLPDNSGFLSTLYKDVAQLIPDKSLGKGNASVRFFGRKSIAGEKDYYVESLVTDINTLLEKGYNPGEITVLVRGKSEGREIADLLIAKNAENCFQRKINVISNESLFLNASQAVNLVIAALGFLINPEDDINRGKLIVGHLAIQQRNKSNQETEKIDFCLGNSSMYTLAGLLPEEFFNNKEKLLSLPLYELSEHLIQLFKLDTLESEVTYLHAFLDLMHEYVHTRPSDIRKFLEYWYEDGETQSITASDSQDAIRILTIHKSKGLQFRAVFVPFCQWKLDQKPNTVLWTQALSDEFGYLPVIPVNYNKSLKQTEFTRAYYSEMLKSHIDNLNLLYVAFTRAVETLIVYSVFNDSGKSGISINSVGDLIYKSISDSEEKLFSDHYNREEKVFRYGKAESAQSLAKNKVFRNDFIRPEKGSSAMDRLFFNPLGYEYFKNNGGKKEISMKQGKVFHHVLEQIITTEDVANVLRDAVFAGLISEEESGELQKHIKECLSDDKALQWFNGSGTVINEREIVLPGGETKRPDRTILYPDHIAVVDYKFGSDQYLSFHKNQVKEYMEILEKMGYPDVKGYLWYVNYAKITEVFQEEKSD